MHPTLSLCYPYYMNPGMLAVHYGNWAAWPAAIKERVEVVIVDDASPTGNAADVVRPIGLPTLSIYRVAVDIPWHQDGARNLGAHVAVGDWLLLTDMDHLLGAAAAQLLLDLIDSGRLRANGIYTMDRVKQSDGSAIVDEAGNPKPHSNSYVMRRDTYWHVGGYDERLCGIYGTDDTYRWRAFQLATPGHIPVALTRYSSKKFPDAATTTLAKKNGRDKEDRDFRIALHRARGINQKVSALDFEWSQVL